MVTVEVNRSHLRSLNFIHTLKTLTYILSLRSFPLIMPVVWQPDIISETHRNVNTQQYPWAQEKISLGEKKISIKISDLMWAKKEARCGQSELGHFRNQWTKMNRNQFSRSVVPNSLWPHVLKHTKLPCPSPTLEAYTNSYPSSRWFHPTISSSVVPFSSCLPSFPASGSFQWVSSSHQVAEVLELQLQHQSFQWTLRTDFP